MTPQEMKGANVAIKGAVADFVSEIAGMFGEWEEVEPRFIETTLMHLSVQLSPLTNEHKSALGHRLCYHRDPTGTWR
jgi:hypothetical protein